MDFRSADAQPQPTHQAVPGAAPVARNSGNRKNDGFSKWLNIGAVVLLFGVTILVVALTLLTTLSNNKSNEDQYINAKDYQAVFLTNGQVYFGNISQISSSYLRLQNIYYLTQSSTTDSSGNATASGNYTLVKLGCQQIHDPLDEMIVERSQVSFWENMNSSGKVVSSIKQFQKSNPNGPDCSQVSSQTQASSNSTTQGTGTTTPKSSTSGQ